MGNTCNPLENTCKSALNTNSYFDALEFCKGKNSKKDLNQSEIITNPPRSL